MNTETGEIYLGEEEIRRARERGEPLREMTDDEVREMKETKTRAFDTSSKELPLTHKNRDASKPTFRRSKVRAKNKAARSARKKNRR